MDGGDPRDDIEHLEERIAELAARIENCRKIMVAARAAVALGLVLLAVGFGGLLALDGVVLAGSVVAVLGGIVLLGSNRSTAQEAEAELAASEARRAELIGSIGLRLVEERPTLH